MYKKIFKLFKGIQEEPNRPPSIYCPIFTRDIIAGDGKTSAKVTWTLPTANDPEDGNLRLERKRQKAKQFLKIKKRKQQS